MLQLDVIQPAKSPWAFSIVLVKKKDGSLRCCVAYRQLNSATRKDAYPSAFICREGQFKFKTMPFGLCNGRATFQRLMDMVMSELALEVCLVYLDDVIVFSTTIDEHFRRLSAVLTKLRLCYVMLRWGGPSR